MMDQSEQYFSNMDKLKTENPFAKEVDALLEDEHIKEEVPLELQGEVIVDRFIGSLIRNGEVDNIGNSDVSHSPVDILELVDGISQPGDLKRITRKGGLRLAVDALAHDPRTSVMFGNLSRRIGYSDGPDSTQKPILKSVAQVEGYLSNTGDRNVIPLGQSMGGVTMQGQEWVPIIAEAVDSVVNKKGNWPEKYKDMRGSTEYLRQSANNWNRAHNSAERMGVDMKLIEKSVEAMALKKRSLKNIGHTAFSSAMNNRVGQYNKDLDRYLLR